MDGLKELIKLKDIVKTLPSIAGKAALSSDITKSIDFCTIHMGTDDIAAKMYLERKIEFDAVEAAIDRLYKEKAKKTDTKIKFDFNK